MKDEHEIEQGVILILEGIGVDTSNANFSETAKRVTKAYREILCGQGNDKEIEKIFAKKFPTTYKGLVAQKDIKTTGMCPHHLLPIKYSIDIGYIADGQALGLSKLVRIAKLLSGRLVLQETLTQDIVDEFVKNLGVAGVIAVVRGEHGCMCHRGVNQNVITTTSSIQGLFEGDWAARQEFLTLNNNK